MVLGREGGKEGEIEGVCRFLSFFALARARPDVAFFALPFLPLRARVVNCSALHE